MLGTRSTPRRGQSRMVAVAFCLMVCLTVAVLTALGAELALAYRAPVVAPAAREAEANAALRRAFADLVLTLADVAVQGDHVAVRFSAHGTH